MRLFLRFLHAALMLFPGAFLLASESTLPVLQIRQEIHDLEIERESPKYAMAAGHIIFRWKPSELPGFGVSRIDFLNNIAPVEESIVESGVDRDMATLSIAFRGKFECHNNFSAYPFNMTRVPIIFKRPAGNYVLQAPNLSKTDLQNADALSASDTYTIVGRTFLEGTFYKAFGSGTGQCSADISAVGLYLDAKHKPLRTIILILLPLLAIWGVSYSSQWWKEESAASRGVMASLFAATAVAIASTNLAPNVSCPTTVILAFCCYYISLFVLGLLTVMAFREKTRAHPEEFRRIRRVGRITGPVLLLAGVVFLTLWARCNRYPEYFEWLGDPVVIARSGFVPSGPHVPGASRNGESPLSGCMECGAVGPVGPNK